MFSVVTKLGIVVVGGALTLSARSPSQRSPASAAGSVRVSIVTFGTNTAEWNKSLHVTGIRMGCNKDPDVCTQRGASHVQTQHVDTIQVAVDLGPETEAYAERYSLLSVAHPFLREISIDDFVSTYYHAYKDSSGRAEALLNASIDKTKSRNPALGFGVTIYETDLESDYLTDPRLASAIRRKVDYVHLYVHHRASGPDYEQYVRAAKQIFPRARVIAGSYPFDRIDYLPCSSTGKSMCSKDQEISLYKESIEIQARLLTQRIVEGLEFYPAYFGMEDKWNGWENPKVCRPERRQECIENTRTMRQVAVSVLSSSGILEQVVRRPE